MPMPDYTYTIEEGVRNLCLGRVLLKDDANAGDTEVPVGDEFAAPAVGAAVIGTMLWYNNSLDIADKDKAVVVEPTAANIPGGIEHQEDITIDTTYLGTKNANFTIAAAGTLANSYTVARGAYARLYDLPAVCETLKFVQDDFLMVAEAPLDSWFPGVYIYVQHAVRSSLHNSAWKDTYVIALRYGCLMDEDWSRATTRSAVLQLADILTEDLCLGGTCYDSKLTRPIVLAPSAGHVLRGGGVAAEVQTKEGSLIDWGDIWLEAWREVAIDKPATP